MMFTPVEPYVYWLALGVLLVIVEMFSHTFVILFFAVSAILVALAKLLFGLENINAELIIFSILGLAGTFFFRKKISSMLGSGTGHVSDENETLLISKLTLARSETEVSYQGTIWTGVNDSDLDINPGTRVVIVRTDGNRLIFRPLK